MSAQKVVESVAGPPPFANAVRAVEGGRYKSGVFMFRPASDQKGDKTIGTEEWCIRYAENRIAEAHMWHIPQERPTVKALDVRVDHTYDPGVIILNSHKRVWAELLLASETGRATWVVLHPGDTQELREKTTVVVRRLNGHNVRACDIRVQWRPFDEQHRSGARLTNSIAMAAFN